MASAMDAAAVEDGLASIRFRLFSRPAFAACRGARGRRKATAVYMAKAYRADLRRFVRLVRMAARSV